LKFGSFILLFLFFISSIQSCAYYVWKKEFTREEKNDPALFLSLAGFIGNPNQALYIFISKSDRQLPHEQFVEVGLSNKTTKPKIVFIHGWNPLERDLDPFTSRARKIDNIKGTFQNAIIHYQENQQGVKSKYDLYLFTYRTSNAVIFNGEGFVSYLKRTFTKDEKVIVVAHSMGGIVTRAAMRSPQYEAGLIDGVITLASPMYGSPFASDEFLKNQTLVNELSSFLIETQGGTDLGYTNNGTNQIPIGMEFNFVLDSINNGFPYNSLFISYAGILNNDCQGAETFYYQTSCKILTNSTPSFASNDGIVSENSAILGGTVFQHYLKSGYDHSMMAFQTSMIDDTKSVSLFREIILKIDELVSR